MKIALLAFMLLSIAQMMKAQSFTGEIRYASHHQNKDFRDTFALLANEEVILRVPIKKGNYATPYVLHLLQENKRYQYFWLDSAWIWMQLNIVVGKNKAGSQPILIEEAPLLGFTCEIYTRTREIWNDYENSVETNKIWVAKDLCIADADDFTDYEPTFFNKTGSIILKQEKNILSTTLGADSVNHYSTLTAISISQQLPAQFQAILADFQKWKSQ